jgi:hypothetical protein
MWFPGSLLARTFTSPCLGREPKAKVATYYMYQGNNYYLYFDDSNEEKNDYF